jgi:CHAT domain-containing protein
LTVPLEFVTTRNLTAEKEVVMKFRVFWAGVVLFLHVILLSAFAQAPAAQKSLTPEAAQIEQLFKEIRTLTAQAKHDEAAAKAQEAITLSQNSGDLARLSRSHFHLGSALNHAGRVEQAIEHFKQASQIAGQAGDVTWQAMSLNTAATLLTGAGLSEEALYFYNQSLLLWRAQKSLWNEAFVLQQMAPLYAYNGNPAQTELNYQEALRLIRLHNATGKDDKGLEKYILLQTAAVELARGNLAQAIVIAENYRAQETPNAKAYEKVEIRINLSNLYLLARKYEQAVTVAEELLALARQVRIPQVEAQALAQLAWANFNLGKAAEALPLITQAVALLQRSGGGRHEGEFLSYLAEIQAATGQREQALESYQRTIQTIERERATMIPTEMAKANLVAIRHSVFTRAIDFLVTQNRAEEALEIAEKYHARAFLDVLAESRIDLRKDLNAAQKKQESELFARIAKIQKELWQPTLPAERVAQLRQELQTTENDLTVFQVELRRTNPRYASVKYPQPLKPADIAQALLKPEAALIEFVLGEKKSYAWVVRRDKISAVTLPDGQTLTAAVQQFRAALSERVSSQNMSKANSKLNATGQQLYQHLLQPLEAHLTGTRELIFVPDGSLVYLPFETLPRVTANQKTEYLLERYAIRYAPSASALAALKTTDANAGRKVSGLIAFGDPIYVEEKPHEKNTPTASALALAPNAVRSLALRNLPYTRREVTAIATLFPRAEQRTFLGAEAREANVKTASLDQFRYVHFAAHGLVDENFPARSGIVLTPETNSKDDGVLQMSEVMRLKLKADLVTLSACRTGLGKLLNGEGMIGLTRAFLYAGAQSVVVSLWDVNDAATATLMKAFYEGLQQGWTKDEALRQAKLTLLKGQQRAWQHPYYWAAFVLVGESQ